MLLHYLYLTASRLIVAIILTTGAASLSLTRPISVALNATGRVQLPAALRS